MAVKCPVCGKVYEEERAVCATCGFRELNREFLSREDYWEWMEQTVKSLREEYQKERNKSVTDFQEALHEEEQGLSNEELDKMVEDLFENPIVAYPQIHKKESSQQDSGVYESVREENAYSSQKATYNKNRITKVILEDLRNRIESTKKQANDMDDAKSKKDATDKVAGTMIASYMDSTHVVSENVVSVACGNSFALGLKKDGTVVAEVDGSDEDNIQEVKKWKDIVSVFCGEYHAIGLHADGTVSAAGRNTHGQCDVEKWKNIVSVACSERHTVGLRKDGTVIATGETRYQMRAVETWKDIVMIACGGSDFTVGLRKDGTVVVAPVWYIERKKIAGWKDIVSIIATTCYVAGLKKDGTVVTTNDEYSDAREWRDIVSISCDTFGMVGIKKDGTVSAVGNYKDTSGGESYASLVKNWKDVESVVWKSFHIVGLRKDKCLIKTEKGIRLIGWEEIMAVSGGLHIIAGIRKSNIYTDIRTWKNIKRISCGLQHVAGLREDGTVVAGIAHGTERYSSRYSGQCSVWRWKDIVDVVCNENYTFGLKNDGTVVVAGGNDDEINSKVGTWSGIKNIYSASFGLFDNTGIIGLNKDGTVVFATSGGLKINGNEVAEGVEIKGMENWSQIVDISRVDCHNSFYKYSNARKCCECISAFCIAGLRQDGTVATAIAFWREKNQRLAEIYTKLQDNLFAASKWRNIKAVAADREFVAGLRKNGTVVVAGNVGLRGMRVKSWRDIISIQCIQNCLVGLKKDGTVVWAKIGNDIEYEISFAALGTWSGITTIKCTSRLVCGLRKDGTVVIVGSTYPVDQYGSEIEKWDHIVALACGVDVVAGLREDGSVVAVGI